MLFYSSFASIAINEFIIVQINGNFSNFSFAQFVAENALWAIVGPNFSRFFRHLTAIIECDINNMMVGTTEKKLLC